MPTKLNSIMEDVIIYFQWIAVITMDAEGTCIAFISKNIFFYLKKNLYCLIFFVEKEMKNDIC